jgi:hypothetical protein
MGGAGLIALFNMSTQDMVTIIRKVKANKLHEPSGGPSAIMVNRNRINDWLWEESQQAGDGAT